MLADDTQQPSAPAQTPAARRGGGGGRSSRRQRGADDAAIAQAEAAGPPVPRMKERFRSDIIPQMMREFGYANPMEVPGSKKSC